MKINLKIIITVAIITVFLTDICGFAKDSCSRNINNNFKKQVYIYPLKGLAEIVYFDKKGKYKDTESISIENYKNSIINEKESEYEKYIYNVQKTLYNVPFVLEENNYNAKDKSSRNKEEYTKIELHGGEYLIYYHKTPLAVEYNRNGDLTGIVQAELISAEKTNITQVFYEYRKTKSEIDEMYLRYIMFVNFGDGIDFAEHIYSADGKLLCRQINNDVYISSESKNIIPNFSSTTVKNKILKLNKSEIETNYTAKNFDNQQKTKKRKIDEEIRKGTKTGSIIIFSVPLLTLGAAMAVTSAPATIPFILFK